MSMAQTDMIRGDIAEVMAQAEYNGEGIDALKNNALLNAGSVVKSIQRGVTEMTSQEKMTVTISSVDISKSLLIAVPSFGTSMNNALRWGISSELTNSTTITFKNRYSSFAERIQISWQVIEFY